ncbi:hypothetical protein CY35_09G102800 [Sphagnum magellanicum]|nr:hypothetical protein CY35_09G102800 [Sphagnum magellanicum]
MKDSPTLEVELPDVTITYTVLPENVEHILKSNFLNYPNVELFQEIFQSLLGDGIFNTDEELWCKQRKIASFEFASKILCNFRTEVFRAYSLKLSVILTHVAAVQNATHMQELLLRVTMDRIRRVCFGIGVGTLEPSLPDIFFVETFKNAIDISAHRFFGPLWKLNRFLNVGVEATMAKSIRQIDDCTYDVISARKQEVAVLQKCGDAKHAVGEAQVKVSYIVIFVISQSIKVVKLGLNFHFSHCDTSASTISWFVYMMILHPEVDKRIIEELCAFEKARKEEADYDLQNGADDDQSSFNLEVAEYP